MDDFQTSLLRERFVIHDPDKKEAPIIAVSNRIRLDLDDPRTGKQETYIIRTWNMHGCARLAARTVQAFRQGQLRTGHAGFDWSDSWEHVVSPYDYKYNPQNWCAVYYNGRPIFQQNQHHPFLDVIEKCDAMNNGEYEAASVATAKESFKKNGKIVDIEYESTVALVINFTQQTARCGIILRGARRSTTFNFTAHAKNIKDPLNIPQCLSACGAFLEGIQLSFALGQIKEKMQQGPIEDPEATDMKLRMGEERLPRIDNEINTLEYMFDVTYRPERPSFQALIANSNALPHRILRMDETADTSDTA
jgi:hypothetical protein